MMHNSTPKTKDSRVSTGKVTSPQPYGEGGTKGAALSGAVSYIKTSNAEADRASKGKTK